ncbi:arginyl-tRNA--protein transferase 1 isoform X2 [Brachyhypopomus gauderio]|uniref:arginyl-tRNA--protein transferase 1 isoform X2 n=1 Tax=Brachyhypopomus gauderio TaxID=698409 RepID=UPI0040410F08
MTFHIIYAQAEEALMLAAAGSCQAEPQEQVMAAGGSYTVVEYFGGDDGHRCGYCKNDKGNLSHGMWSHAMRVQDYQDLIDRGWRRSGKYVYKPVMNKTCCPQYTIRCHALNFHPSKTHKKILKRMKKFLSNGDIPLGQPQYVCEGELKDAVLVEEGGVLPLGPRKVQHSEVELPIGHSSRECKATLPDTLRSERASPPGAKGSRLPPKAGVGPDPSRPLCRKAKDIRKERRVQKDHQNQDGGALMTPNPAPSNPTSSQGKTLEEFISDSLPSDLLHRLEVRLVPVSFEDPGFLATYKQSVALYARYQMAIHGDSPFECEESQAEPAPDGPDIGYGSFHQQYWLDNSLVAVGVIDILPNSVSSVYLYYHPDFATLSLGTYSALREIAFTRQLQKQSPQLAYYYLGFYIHSCPKMRYKLIFPVSPCAFSATKLQNSSEPRAAWQLRDCSSAEPVWTSSRDTEVCGQAAGTRRCVDRQAAGTRRCVDRQAAGTRRCVDRGSRDRQQGHGGVWTERQQGHGGVWTGSRDTEVCGQAAGTRRCVDRQQGHGGVWTGSRDTEVCGQAAGTRRYAFTAPASPSLSVCRRVRGLQQ